MRVAAEDVEWTAVRAQGAGGQNVNKVSTAIHLRFDIHASSLPDRVKERLIASSDQRITEAGVVVIKAQRYRSLDKNLEDALDRLNELIGASSAVRLVRRPTKPTRGSKVRRVEGKVRRGRIKSGRRRVVGDDK